MAIALSGVLMAGISQLLNLAAKQRYTAQQRFAARHELDSLMESAMTLPWNHLTADGLATVQMSKGALDHLPQAKLQAQAVNENDDTRRLHLHLSWFTREAAQHQSLSLVGWRFKPEEVQP